MRIWCWVVLSLAMFTTGRTSSAESTPAKLKIAVLDLAANGARPELASTLTSIVAARLQRLQVFSVVTNQDLRAILSHEALEQMTGCEASSSCTAHIGADAVGARYLLSGSVGEVSQAFSLNLVVTDLEKGQVVGRASENVHDAGQLSDASERAAQKVVAGILSERQGVVLVTSTESGATVKIDDEIVGVTPLPRRSVSWGPHQIRIEKEGFISGAEDISVTSGAVIERHFALIPSDDFLQEYESSASRMRLGAWLTTGGAVLALGGAAYFQIAHMKAANEFLSQRDTYEALANPTTAQYDALNTARTPALNDIHWAYALSAASAALGLGAAYFWIAGGDPDRYGQYREAMLETPPRPWTVAWRVASASGLVGAELALP